MTHILNPFRFAPAQRMKLALALLRVGVGAYLLWMGYQKLKNPQFAVMLPSMLANWASSNPFFFYEDFLRHIALLNAQLLAPVIIWSEIGVGACLILGVLVGLAAPAMLVLNLNYFFATQHTGPAAQGLNLFCMLAALTLWLGDAGQCGGMDQLAAWVKSKFSKIESGRTLVHPKSAKSGGKSGKGKEREGKNSKGKAVSASQIQKAFATLKGRS